MKKLLICSTVIVVGAAFLIKYNMNKNNDVIEEVIDVCYDDGTNSGIFNQMKQSVDAKISNISREFTTFLKDIKKGGTINV